MIDADGLESKPLLAQWGEDWAQSVRDFAKTSLVCASYDAEVVGQAIAGALHQAGREAHRAGRPRDALAKSLTAFLTRALKPD